MRNGVPVVTDGPYAETQEVLAGYWIVECASMDRAVGICAELATCPGPTDAAEAFIDLRTIMTHGPRLDSSCSTRDRTTLVSRGDYRVFSARAHLHETAGELSLAHDAYVAAARLAPNLAQQRDLRGPAPLTADS